MKAGSVTVSIAKSENDGWYAIIMLNKKGKPTYCVREVYFRDDVSIQVKTKLPKENENETSDQLVS
jgi:hypothetical protein